MVTFIGETKIRNIRMGGKKYSSNFINLVLPLEQSSIKNGCIYVANKKDTKKIGKPLIKSLTI